MSIEGIPEGWELVRAGGVKRGEFRLGCQGQPLEWTDSRDSASVNYVVVRKKGKQYRPFANAAEFEPFRDRWVVYTSPCRGDESLYRISAINSERVWLGPDNSGKTYREAFHCLKFDDGTPFGVEVTE